MTARDKLAGPEEETADVPMGSGDTAAYSECGFANETFPESEERIRTEETSRQSEAFFRTTFEKAAVGMAIVDFRGRILDTNAALSEMFGYSRDEFAGMNYAEITYPEDLAPSLQVSADLASGRLDRIVWDKRFIRKDGQTIWVHLSSSLVRDDRGAPYRIVSILEDITERRQMEEHAARLAAIVASSNDAIIGKTLDGIVTSWNRGAERIYGYVESEMIGRPMSVLVPPDRIDEIPHFLDRVRLGEEIEHYETVHIRKDGRSIQVSLAVSPVFDTTGRVVGASAIGRDISEQKRSEEALLRANLELEQRVKERTASIESKNEELARMNRLFVGRELRMIELKQRVSALEEQIQRLETRGQA